MDIIFEPIPPAWILYPFPAVFAALNFAHDCESHYEAQEAKVVVWNGQEWVESFRVPLSR